MIKNFLNEKLILAAGIIIFLFLAISSTLQKSITFDESYNLLRGLYPLRTGHVSPSLYHPPLVNMIAAVPLALNSDVKLLGSYQQGSDTGNSAYELIWHNKADAEWILYSGRFMMIGLGVLLLILIYAWAKEAYGFKGALLAFGFALFCPNLTAHSTLATTDLGVSLFVFLAAYLFWRWLSQKTLLRLCLAGLGLGLAEISKYSAIVLFPVFAFILLISTLREFAEVEKRNRMKLIGVRFSQFLGMILINFAVISIFFFGHPELYFKSAFTFSSGAVKSLPMIYYLGNVINHAPWHMPFVAFFLKTPLPVLILFFFVLLSIPIWRLAGNNAARTTDIVSILLILVFFFTTVLINKKTELRYLLPIYPFIFLLIGRAGVFIKTLPFKLFIFGMAAWQILETAIIYPDYLAYFNELAGGPNNGHKYLLNSNLDWGQDLKGLAKYMKEKNIPSVGLSYFGQADPVYYKINFELIPSSATYNSTYSSLGRYRNRPYRKPIKGYIAVSISHLDGIYVPPAFKGLYEAIRQKKPEAIIGRTIYVYRFK